MEEGNVFKVVENRIKTEGKILLHSLNPLYGPYDINIQDIREIWQFVHYISSKIPENLNSENYHLVETVKQLRNDIQAIQTRLNI